MEYTDKYEKLKEILKKMKSLLVAYSGGVDSTLLLAAVSDAIKDSSMAVTAESAARQKKESKRARKICKEFGIRHMIINSRELYDQNVANNTKKRCYFCKKGLFLELIEIAKEHSINFVADGSNIDDLSMYRPGKKALEELGIRSPLLEAGFTKKDIRKYSKELGLETWELPVESCYLTRFPYGTVINAEKLEKVALAEKYINNMGFKEVRLRIHDDRTSLEVAKSQVPGLRGEKLDRIGRYLKDLGLKNITVDPLGYRTGSMDGE